MADEECDSFSKESGVDDLEKMQATERTRVQKRNWRFPLLISTLVLLSVSLLAVAVFFRAAPSESTYGEYERFRPVAMSAKQREQIVEMLELINEVSEETGVPYTLCEGTALGAVRHHGIIPWDDDIDLCFHDSDREVFKAAMLERIGKGDKYGWMHWNWIKNWDFYKLYVHDSELSFANNQFKFPFIDLFFENGKAQGGLTKAWHKLTREQMAQSRWVFFRLGEHEIPLKMYRKGWQVEAYRCNEIVASEYSHIEGGATEFSSEPVPVSDVAHLFDFVERTTTADLQIEVLRGRDIRDVVTYQVAFDKATNICTETATRVRAGKPNLVKVSTLPVKDRADCEF